MKKNLFTLIVLLVCTCGLYAQDTRTEKVATIKTALNNYLATKKGQKHTPEIEKQIQAQLNNQEPGHLLIPAQKKQQYEELNAFFWENQFWKIHPDYATYVSQRDVGNGANLCKNGGFEEGNKAFTHFGSFFNAGGSDNCLFANTIAFNPTIATDPTANVINRMEVVGAGADPVVAGLTRTHSGNAALRVNSGLTSTGSSCGGYDMEIDAAATTFVLDASTRLLSFWFAVVMEDPNHNEINGQNPFFTARVTNHATEAVLNICLDPSQNNLQNAGVFCRNDSILWQGWRCAVFDMSHWAIGTTVTLEFIAADCGGGKHFGYAYIDDICAGCNITGSNGGVTITTKDSCYTDGVRFNGMFTLPITRGSALQSIVVQLHQNGNVIATIPVTITGNTFTGIVPANLLTNGSNYDLISIANFNVPGTGTVTTVGEVKPGINNDFIATDVGCCDPNSKPDFLLSVNPTSANYAITAIGFNTYALANAVHEWYVLSSPNQFGGPYTPVTSLISTTQTTVPLISNAEYGLFYTVIHKVKTLCGEVCIARTQYQSPLGRAEEVMQNQSNCCLAFEFWPNGAGTEPEEFTATFELGSTPNGNGTYTIDTYPGSIYSNNPSVTHHWYVFTSPNPTGGPYTQVGQGSGASYAYSPAKNELYYFVAHRVKSPCGDVCYGQSICRNCPARQSEGCDLCGPIDCKKLDELLGECRKPTDLEGSCKDNILTWSAVGSATGYVVQFSFNNPDCCPSLSRPINMLETVTDNKLDLKSIVLPHFNCFKWRVMPKCSRSVNDWSDWKCFSCAKGVTSDDNENPFSTPKRMAAKDGKVSDMQPRIAPNPNNGEMILSLQALGDLILSVDVINAQGMRVTSIARNTYRGGLFNYQLNLGHAVGKGIYTVVFNTNYGTFRKKVIVQ